MKKMQKFIVFILLFAFVFIGIFTMNVAQAAKLPKGSTIAGISLDGLSTDEARNKLVQSVESWKAKGTIAMKSDEETILVPRSSFQFDIENTLTEMEQKTKRRWYTFFLKPKNVHLSLKVTFNETDGIEWPDYVDKKAAINEAVKIASELGEREGKIVYETNKQPSPTKIAETTFKIPTNVSDVVLTNLINKMNGLQIEPQLEFSFIESVLEPLNMTKSSDEINLVASAFYSTVLQSSIDIIERHSQGEVPSYTQAGIEAKVSRAEKKDLKLYNRDFYSYIVNAEKRDGNLVMSLHVAVQEASYDYRVANVKEIKPRIVYRYSSKLNPGEKQTVRAGSKGLKVEVYREQISGGDKNSELISRDYYPPKPTIILASSLGLGSQMPEQEQLEGDSGLQENENMDGLNFLTGSQDDLSELVSSIRKQIENEMMNHDPFQALKEMEQQFNEILELIQQLTVLMNLNEIQCESFEDEKTRALCEEMKENFQVGEREAIPTMR